MLGLMRVFQNLDNLSDYSNSRKPQPVVVLSVQVLSVAVQVLAPPLKVVQLGVAQAVPLPQGYYHPHYWQWLHYQQSNIIHRE
jgi:hypothetical protein